MAPDTAALTVRAVDVHPWDSIAEGSIVIRKEWQEIEQRHPLTGAISRVPVVDIDCVPARIVVVDTLPSGQHMHNIDRSTVETRRFAPNDEVRVVRPGPVEPCECGVK